MTTNHTNSSKFTLAKAAGATMFTLILVATATQMEARSVYMPEGGNGRGPQGNNGHGTNRGGYGQGNNGHGTNRGSYGQGNGAGNSGYNRNRGPVGNAGGYSSGMNHNRRPNSVTNITNNNTYVNRVSKQDWNRGARPGSMNHGNDRRGPISNGWGNDRRGPISNGWGSDRRGPISSGYGNDRRGPYSKGFDRDHRGPIFTGGRDRRPMSFARHGRFIPEYHFHSRFGRDHGFRVSRPLMLAGYRRFQHGGVTWGINRPWPATWLASDYVYVDYIGGGYFLCNRRFPTVRIPVTVDACATCVAAPPAPVCTTCVEPPPPPPVCDTCAPPVAVTPACDNCTTPEVPVAQADCTDCAPQGAPALVRGQTIADVVSIMGAPTQSFQIGYKQIYLYPTMKVVFVGGRMVEAI
jgi:hypothetical protein